MSMTTNKKLELLAQEIYAKGVNKQTHYDTPQGKVAYPKVDYDKLWEDDDYRDSISEKLHDETAHMLEAHQEYLREIAEEEKA